MRPFLKFWGLTKKFDSLSFDEWPPILAYAALPSERMLCFIKDNHPNTYHLMLDVAGPVLEGLGDFHYFLECCKDGLVLDFSASGKRSLERFAALKNLAYSSPEDVSLMFRMGICGTHILISSPSLAVLSFKKGTPEDAILNAALKRFLFPLLDLRELDDGRADDVLKSLFEFLAPALEFAWDDAVKNVVLPTSRYQKVAFLNASLIISMESESPDGFFPLPLYVQKFLDLLSSHYCVPSQQVVRNLAWLCVDAFIHDLPWFGVDELSIHEGIVLRVARHPRLPMSLPLLIRLTSLQFIHPLELPSEEAMHLFFTEMRECCTLLEKFQTHALPNHKLEELQTFSSSLL